MAIALWMLINNRMSRRKHNTYKAANTANAPAAIIVTADDDDDTDEAPLVEPAAYVTVPSAFHVEVPSDANKRRPALTLLVFTMVIYAPVVSYKRTLHIILARTVVVASNFNTVPVDDAANDDTDVTCA